MKRIRIKTYALSILAISGILTATFGFYQNQNTPSYQPKKSIAFENAVGRFDLATQYNKLLKGDPLTGKINPKHVIASRKSVANALNKDSKADAMGLIWSGLGPDNVGGRTRAIVIDRNNPNIMLAGGVAGGVYVSFDASQSWQPRMGGTNLTIAAMAQTTNGYYYIGTGPRHDGPPRGSSDNSDNSMGDGLYRIKTVYAEYEHLVSTADFGTDWDGIYEIVAHPINPDILFVASAGGLQISKNASSAAPTFTEVTGIGGSARDVDITPDGNIVIATTNNRVYRSTDGGETFTLALNFTTADNISRIECAISPTDGNYIYLSAVRGTDLQSPEVGCLHSILQSSDAGVTWNVIAKGETSGTTATFDPFANPGINCQGVYDNAIAVFPNDPGKILVGGIQLWQGELLAGSSPPSYGWTQVAVTNGGPGSEAGVYVHADKHRILIPDANTIYVGSDGGIAKSTDGGNLWVQNNLGYRVTQFYSLAIVPQFIGPDLVMGGTQDNGTLLIGANSETNTSIANQVQGGDGFDCEFSTLATSVFATSQFGAVRRVEQSGNSSGTFWDDELEAICEDECGPFYTSIEYWETRDADLTFDSVLVKADTNYAAGDSITYLSATNGIPVGYKLTSPLLKGDSTMLPDHVQSRFIFANATNRNSIYMTQDAPNLTVTVPEWSRIADATLSYPDKYNGETFTMEFSFDGNHLFIGTLSGELYRISNMLYAYDSLTSDIRSSSCVLTCTRIASTGGIITGIASDPSNIDHIVVTVGGYNQPNSVYRITNASQALSGTANITSIQGDLPPMPVFDAEIDVSNPDIVLIGTEFGVWATKKCFIRQPGMDR